MDANRKTAYFTLMDIESKKAYSNIALNHHIIVGKPNSQAFVRELVYGVLENKMFLDYIIDQFVKTGTAKMNISDLTILRMGIYQLGYMNSVPEYAAVNESVILAKRFARGREGFINGVLREYIKRRFSIQLPDRSEDLVRYLSIKYSYEPWIVELWLDQYSEEEVEALLKAGNETPKLAVRINWLKVMKADIKKRFEDFGCEVEDGKFAADALYVKGSGLTESKMFRLGLFSIQDESSQLVAEVIDPKQGDTIIDVCAAPGGKTLAMAERMNNKGRIIASDIYRRRLNIINDEAKRLGVTIIETKPWDASVVDPNHVGIADRVLVDAPCSGLGVVRRKPEIKYKKLSGEQNMLPIKQLEILTSSSKYVKSGGTLVYSTCTINDKENRDVISEFLRKNPEFKKEKAIQLLPSVDGTDGFFICKMVRI